MLCDWHGGCVGSQGPALQHLKQHPRVKLGPNNKRGVEVKASRSVMTSGTHPGSHVAWDWDVPTLLLCRQQASPIADKLQLFVLLVRLCALPPSMGVTYRVGDAQLCKEQGAGLGQGGGVKVGHAPGAQHTLGAAGGRRDGKM